MPNLLSSMIGPDDVQLLRGNTGMFLAYHDGTHVSTRVLACEDHGGDVTGVTVRIGRPWQLTAALIVLAGEAATDVEFAAHGTDRGDVWETVRRSNVYTGICNEFYYDGDWTVVCYSSNAKA